MGFLTELSYLNDKKAKVCIIGSGAGGLSAISVFRKHLDKFEIDVYEKSNSVGGTWVYTDEIEKDEFGLPVHSSMYKNLITNIPMCIMEFSDFKVVKNAESFVSHKEVLNYLESYAKQINAYDFINFHHLVNKVKKEKNSWKVEILNLKTNEFKTHYYDVVIVCNGRYSKPKTPTNVNLKKFKGEVLHSHTYRKPDTFENKNVIVVGAGPSGLDISMELSNYCKKVYFVHLSKINFSNIPNNVEQIHNTIASGIDNKIFLAKNDQVLDDISKVVFATGYNFDHDFFDENVGINLDSNNKLNNVYLHLLNSLHPTMCLLAIPHRFIPFPFYQMQINWFLKVLLGDLKLPSKNQMDNYEEKSYNELVKHGLNPRYYHKMLPDNQFWDYIETICDQANIPRMIKSKKEAFNYLHKLRRIRPSTYKETKFFIINDNEYIVKK